MPIIWKKSHTYPANKFEIQTKKKNLGDSKLFIDEKHQSSHLQHLRLEGDTSLSTDDMTTQPRYNLHMMVKIYVKIQSLKYIGR